MATTCKLIAKNVLGSDTFSVTFGSIPATFDDLLLLISARSTRSTATVNQSGTLIIKPNNSSSNLSHRALYGNGSSAASFAGASENQIWIPANSSSWTANTFGNIAVYFPNYAGSTNKSWTVDAVIENNNAAGFIMATAARWSDTTAISSIVVSEINYNILSGSSFYLYGITKA